MKFNAIIIGVIIALTLAVIAFARPFTQYMYLTNREVTEFGEIIWFWTPDTLYGRVHSNDFIGLKYSPTFYGPVSSSKCEFRLFQPGNIYFEFEPVLCAPPIPFPRRFSNLWLMARIIIDDDNGNLMTVMRFRGEQGIDISQYRLGTHPIDSLSRHIEVQQRQIICVDGQLEIEGIVSGKVTVCASGDVWLTDNLRYLGSHVMTGAFDQDTTTSLLALISEQNIIIKDNILNGKENGYFAQRNNWNRHSIVLNGYFIALNTSFTFEHQNDDWNGYQGPEPDERGYVYVHGGITQERRGYVHRANHGGTGYGKAYRWDFRLDRMYPTGLSPEETPEYEGSYDSLIFDSRSYDVKHKIAARVVVLADATINLMTREALTATDSLIVRGTVRQPVRFTASDIGGLTASNCYVDIRHAIFDYGVMIDFSNSNIHISNSSFTQTPVMSGTIRLDSCKFESRFDHRWSGEVTVTRSSFHNHGVSINGARSRLTLDHVTIAGGNGNGVEVSRRAQAVITNSIVSFMRRGVYADDYSSAWAVFCDVYGNDLVDFLNCEPGEGTLSSDPLFFDLRNGNFNLNQHSPCIDAGDPDSPLDPDGTGADIGAFYFDHELAAGDPPFNSPPASRGGKPALSASPNPFNSTTVIRLNAGPINREATIRIYDLSGREVFTTAASPQVAAKGQSTVTYGEVTAGLVSWDASSCPAGIYIARYENGRETHSIKLVKVN